jgi:hypothetical protein
MHRIDPAETVMSHARRRGFKAASGSTAVAAQQPLSWGVTLARGLWPFWLFKDPNQGDLYARAAASAHNRRMSEVLPRYLRRWLLVSAIASLSICANDAMATDVARRLDVFVLMAAGSGLVCAYALCVAMVIGYAWCYLRLAQR